MTERRNEQTSDKLVSRDRSESRDSDTEIMKKIRTICRRGHNAEIRQRKDGTLTVMEVQKNIV